MTAPGSEILVLPDRAVRTALVVLKDAAASELEILLAASVVHAAGNAGIAVPAWATEIVEGIVSTRP